MRTELPDLNQQDRVGRAWRFKRATVLTPHQYTVRLRIARAKALLARSELPITEVAARAGFTDQSHFTTIFRRMTSVRPGNDRNAMSD